MRRSACPIATHPSGRFHTMLTRRATVFRHLVVHATAARVDDVKDVQKKTGRGKRPVGMHA